MWRKKKTAETLEEDLCRLRRRVDELESRAKIAKLESAEVYDKTLRLMQRMAKRYAVDLADAAPSGDGPTPPGNSTGLDPISAKIMERRGMRRQAE